MDCDPSNPKEHAAWCWAAGIPDPSPVRPNPIPLIAPQLAEGLSQLLWDFGFRHHPDLQTKWIQGSAGLGGVAQVVDAPPVGDDFTEQAESFLAEHNPDLLKRIKEASPEERANLLRELEGSMARLEKLLKNLKED